ncbi:MAG: cell division protein FtsA [Verrucomicrobia bacterium]|nr:cell division protein FtsA [Kiritimatiellia bacterium]MCP5488278.1 cell division protein FtsA [Verrucomicrobiota bacterium]
MSDYPPIVALELGTTKARCVVAEIRDDDHLMILGVGECESRGIRKSEVINLDTAISCVKIAIDNAEESANAILKEVYLMASGGSIQSLVNRGSIPIMSDDHEIIREDINHVIQTARNLSLSDERQILHSICQHFYVDDQKGITNPEGMEGYKLSVDMLIIHGLVGRLRNLVRAARSASVEVVNIAYGGLCAALATLTPEDKHSGCMVIDLGGGTTDFIAYADNAIATAGSLAIGGDHVTNDISSGLRISSATAEKLKIEAGSAVVNLPQRMNKLPIPDDPGSSARVVRYGDLHTIIHARMEELFQLVRGQVKQKDLLHRLGSGIILTGGGANLTGVTELGEKVFGLPCRVGRPRDVSGFTSVINMPDYAAPLGLLRFAARDVKSHASAPGIRGWIKGLLGFRSAS